MKSNLFVSHFFTRKHAALWLGVSLRLVDLMIELGELPVRRIGRRVLISRCDLEEFARRDHATRPRTHQVAMPATKQRGGRHAE